MCLGINRVQDALCGWGYWCDCLDDEKAPNSWQIKIQGHLHRARVNVLLFHKFFKTWKYLRDATLRDIDVNSSG